MSGEEKNAFLLFVSLQRRIHRSSLRWQSDVRGWGLLRTEPRRSVQGLGRTDAAEWIVSVYALPACGYVSGYC